MPGSGPLSGKTILVTRPRARSGGLLALLARRGARGIAAPMVAFAPGDRKGLARGGRALLAGDYDWVFFTSVNGVEASRRLLGTVARAGVKVGAVGPATAAALRRAGCRVDLVPELHTGAALASAWKRRAGKGARGARVLLLQPEIASFDLARGLRKAGARVERVVAYRTLGTGRLPRRILCLARAGRIDWVTLTSPSTALHLARALIRGEVPVPRIPAASIGPVTTRAARRLGFRILAESPDQTERGLARAVVDAEKKRGKRRPPLPPDP